MSETNQSDLFQPVEPDLFGTPGPETYTPDPQHVRNRLDALLNQMRASAIWPWPDVMVELHRTKTFDYLVGLLPAPEASTWRAAIAAEIDRLDPPAQAAE
jgi:hypothetical protein